MLQRLVFILVLSLSFAVQAKTFKIATIFPDGTNWMNMARAGANEIAKRTEGRVKFRFYPGGIMGNDATVLRKIRIGQLQGGALTGGGVADILPDSQVYGIPFIFHSQAEVDYVRKHMDQQILDSLKQKGFISFGLSGGGFAYLMSSNRIATIDDLKQQKVWSPQGDQISRAAFEAIGVSPIPLPVVDVLTGLQTGLINTIGSSPMGAIALQWHTRVKYLADIPLVYLYATLVVKRRDFEKLSTADQAVVQEVMQRTFAGIAEQNKLDNKAARAALKKQGIVFIKPTGKLRQMLHDKVAPAMTALAKRGLFSESMLQTLRKHLDDYRQGRNKNK